MQESADPRSVHDNNIFAYSVDCQKKRIILHTCFSDGGSQEFTDVVFSDVLAHFFEHVLEVNILFDIEEVDVQSLVKDNSSKFATAWLYGWPPVEYDGNIGILVAKLTERSMRGFQISSSCGLSGWVLAQNYERIGVSPPAGNA